MSSKKGSKMLNLNSPIFDDLYNRNEYTDIVVNMKNCSFENEKKVFKKDDDYQDQLYIDYKMKACDKDCSMCNLYKIYDFYKTV